MAAAAVKPLGPTMQPTPPPPKARPTSEPREPRAKRDGKLGPALRIIISIVIVWHFTAIFLAALCIPATSPLVLDIAQKRPMQWYLDVLFMNQGHAFFAPDVGPGHVMRYELFDARGQSMGAKDLPSAKEYWPRLRYHRHMMLADQAPMGNDQEARRWQQAFLQAYARQILRDNPQAEAVRLRHYAHWPLPMEFETKARKDNYGYQRAYQDFAKAISGYGIKMDENGYELLMEVTQRRSDLGAEQQPNQASGWQGGQVETAGRWRGGPR